MKGDKVRMAIGGIAGAVVLLLAFSWVYSKAVCGSKWYGRTTVNGVDVSGYSLEESEKLFPDGSDYTLTVTAREDGKLTVASDDISYAIKVRRDSLQEVFDEQHDHLTFPWSPHELEAANDVSYDESALKTKISQSELVTGSSSYPITEPVAAQVVYSDEKDTVEIEKEIYGNHIDGDELYDAVCEALDQGTEVIDVSDGDAYPDMYLQPELLATDQEMKDRLEEYRYYITRFLTWDLQMGDSETMTPKDIFGVTQYTDAGVTYNREKLSEWIEPFCLKYKTADKDRTITNHNGQKVTVPAGDYGWCLDYEATMQQTGDTLNAAVDKKAADAYLEDPSEANKKAITTDLETIYKTVGFRKDYENYEDWDPDNFIEVSLSEQMIYVHENGEIVYSCRTITGKPVEGRETKKGVYYIKEHQEERVLVGEDYETPVKNWVRITWTGTGFHAAPWQKWGSWTPTYYVQHGSHGCMNLTLADSEKMYGLAKYKEAVFIY